MRGMNATYAPAATAREASFPERSRSRVVGAAHVGRRLIGVATARFAFRRGQTLLAASGAARAAAMLALTLATQAGVEDTTFAARLGLQRGAAPKVFLRPLTVSVPLNDRTRRSYREIDHVIRRRLAAEGWKPIATAFATVPGGLVAMGNRLERFLQPDEGRLPRTCTPRLCEFVWLRPPPTTGMLPPPSRPPAIPGFRLHLVGTAHQIGPAPLLDFPAAVTRGFGLLGSEEVARGGVLGWHVPLRKVVEHPWD